MFTWLKTLWPFASSPKESEGSIECSASTSGYCTYVDLDSDCDDVVDDNSPEDSE